MLPVKCGGENEPACPPQPAAMVDGVSYYTHEQMLAHGAANYAKGTKDGPQASEPQENDL